mmetsp:Transcript_14952/g.46746  ORF Transcript_14952/g.46746 Transcript_14952/m.46746 type:complete len:231 (-) Transcript_14952:27-719(-)
MVLVLQDPTTAVQQPSEVAAILLRAADSHTLGRLDVAGMQSLVRVLVEPDLEHLPAVLAEDHGETKHPVSLVLHALRLCPAAPGAHDVVGVVGHGGVRQAPTTCGPEGDALALPRRGWRLRHLLLVGLRPEDGVRVHPAHATRRDAGEGHAHGGLQRLAQRGYRQLEEGELGVHHLVVLVRVHSTHGRAYERLHQAYDAPGMLAAAPARLQAGQEQRWPGVLVFPHGLAE